MKKFLLSMLTLSMILACSVPTFAAEGMTNVGTVPGTTEAPVLDGVKDAVYDNALVVDGSINKDTLEKGTATVTWYVTYTEDALWAFAEVQDATLEVESLIPEMPDYKVDSLELMLDPTNEGMDIAMYSPYQMRIDHYNQISGRIGKSGITEYNRESEEDGTIVYFDAQAVKTDVGFNAEYKVMVDEDTLGECLVEGQVMGVNFCYNDWDAAGATREQLTSKAGVTSWTVTDYDTFTLGAITEPAAETEAPETEAPVEETEAPVEETEAPAEETEAAVEETEAVEEVVEVVEAAEEEKAPQTFDAAVIAAVSAVIAGAGYTICKKK